MDPTHIGAYRVLRRLGEGGMGVVYLGVHEAIERRVAIKIMFPRSARSVSAIGRFFNEARAVNRVGHPGLVEVSDFGQQDGVPYLVMEYLEGENLAERLHVRRLSVIEALRLGRRMAAALAAAHDKGIVHRDLKPANVMLVPDAEAPGGERVKLLDFGIAKLTEPGSTEHTGENVVMGTPAYMSPEQCRGAAQVDGRTDVYALGVILYEALAGRPPFVAPGAGELVSMHLTQEPPPLRAHAPEVPEAVAGLMHRLLSKDRALRPPMRQVLGEIEGLLAQAGALETDPGAPRLAAGRRRVRDVAAVLAVVALAVPVALLLRRPAPVVTAPAVTPAVTAPAPAPPPPRRVRWAIASVPPAADVLRAADGRLLGKTPWEREQPAGKGSEELIIRLDGFGDQRVTLDRDGDAAQRVVLQRRRPQRRQEARLGLMD